MQTILVAGGSGFIGSNLCENLLKRGNKIICVDNFLTSTHRNIASFEGNPSFTFIKHDITRPLSLKEKIDAIYHLASAASPNHHSRISYHAYPKETMLANTSGTFLLLGLAQKNKAKFLFASSSEVYGDPLEHPQKEDYRGNTSTTGPRSVYDESKRFGETITAYFNREKNLDTRIARIFNTYGPKMIKEDMRMIITFITQALEGVPITIFGDGKQTRPLCFIDDLVDGLVRLMESPQAKGEVVNLGSTDEHTVLEYAEIVKRLTNSKSEIIFSEKLPQDDPTKRRPDIEKANKLLSWEPKVSLEEGLKKTIEYIRSHNS
ncbi:MAG: NAD-dependent epimerase/dehydratase family protein [Candidatus Levybacteria bacterium]|nr:NAD-dependent epimerase/dehydratase family protein [Candidatus Levybacteria bacterium]